MNNKRIGVFDSGLGGLTVANSILQELPEEKILYFGDTARVPYGSKEVSLLKRFAVQIADFLIENDAKILVIACNTVSATCKDYLQERFPQIDVIDVIRPMVEKVASDYKDKKVGIVGTKVTIESNIYERLIKEKNPSARIVSKECTSLVTSIEESINNPDIIEEAIKECIDDFIEENDIEALVLGCTHFPLIFNHFQRLYPNVEFLNPSKEVVSTLERKLEKKNIKAENSDLENLYFASEMSDNFSRMVDYIDSGKIPQLKMVTSE